MGTVRPHGFYVLDVRLGYFLGFVVGVAHLITAELAFTANFTCSCHGTVLRSFKNRVKSSRTISQEHWVCKGKM